MRAWFNYAQIYNGIVQAICVGDDYEEVNQVARCAYGDEAFAVDVTYCHPRKNDHYHDGNFWRVNEETGEEILIPFEDTEAQEIEALKIENAKLVAENASLQEEVTNTQLALTELYETSL